MASSEIGDLAEKLVRELEELVRAAEERGAQIVREAEAEAEKILAAARERAEAEPTEQQQSEPPEIEKLTAMRLALQGADEESIRSELETRFGPGDRSELVAEVLRRADAG